MDLQTANKRLAEILIELPEAIRKLSKIEYKYNLRYLYVMSHSLAGTQSAREADAVLTCETEDLYKPFTEAKIDVRTLYIEKELLIEISKNIRTLRGNE